MTVPYSATNTPTITETCTVTPTSTETLTSTQTITFSSTCTATASLTITFTPTESDTFTHTRTFTGSPTYSATQTPSDTHTQTPTRTETPSRTATPTGTDTRTITQTNTLSPTFSASPTITPTFTPSAPFHVDIRIYNSAGELVGVLADGLGVYAHPRTLQAVAPAFVPDGGGKARLWLAGPEVAVAWDGTLASGQYVASGAYTVQASVRDPWGHVEVYNAAVSVIRRDPDFRISIFSPSGELIRHWVRPSAGRGTSDSIGLSAATFAPGLGPDLAITYGPAAGDTVAWNGTNDRGEPVASGQYLVKVERVEGQASAAPVTRGVTVIQGTGASAGEIRPVPNPVSAKDDHVDLLLTPGLAPGSVHGVVYTLAGERVAQMDNRLDPTRLSWNLGGNRMASGLYIVRVRFEGFTQKVPDQVVKLGIVR
jgi:hypothetical protein